jgi:hypothetical protein
LNKDEVKDERPPIMYEVEKSNRNTRQKKCGKTKSQENLTERENAKNYEKTFTNDVEHAATSNTPSLLRGGNMVDEKPASIKQETGKDVDKRKKNKERKMSGNSLKERRVIVNGSGHESGTYVEHTRGVKLPVREEAEPRHCGKETPAHETENQGKKTKNRKKKKAEYFGKISF